MPPAKMEKVSEDALSHTAIPENIELTKKLDADLPEVEVGSDQIHQVLVSIIINFEPLFTTKAKGPGLGLAVRKAIIDRHEGNIEVKSEEKSG